MKKFAIIILSLSFPLFIYSQIVKSNEIFTNVQTFEGKVIFIKEIQLKNSNINNNYSALKEWGKTNYAKDLFNSSLHYDDNKKSLTVQSRIELLLPESTNGLRAKLNMKYRLNAFFDGNLCIMEITNINYINDRKQNNNNLDQKIKAENLITPQALAIKDSDKQTRADVQKNTLYFINDLVNSLEKALNP